MRVIAGSARSLKLKTPDGLDTRPTTDRIKETLFNIIGPTVYDSIFLDLFSGSGGIGIEALSRGAREAVFVENNPKAMRCIKDNLRFTRLESKAVTITTDVMNALYRLEGEKIFDIIFMDPPYNRELERKVLEYLSKHRRRRIFLMQKNWDSLSYARKSTKRINMCLLGERGLKKYVKSNLSRQF